MNEPLNAALLAVLRDRLGIVDLQYQSGATPVTLHGGHSSDLYHFALEGAPTPFDGSLVLRVIRKRSDERAARERDAQDAAAQAGYPTPSVFLFGGSEAGLGNPFSIMRAVTGQTPLAAAGIVGLPRLFREIPGTLANVMAQLHRLPIEVSDGVDELLAGVADRDIFAWLAARRPSEYQRVLCHGDLHGENILVVNGEVTAVLDWELACGGPRELDVARTALILAVLPGISRTAARLLARVGQRSANRFVDSYRQLCPVDTAILAWFDVAHTARALNVASGHGTIADAWRPTIPALKARLAQRMRS